MILVTGATGTTGSALVRDLLDRGLEVAAMTRDPARVPDRPGLTATTVVVPADAMYLLPPAARTPLDHEENLLRAAKAAGIPRVVRLSAIGTPDEDHDLPPGHLGAWHFRGERTLRRSGLEWTVLRPTTFATNSLAWAPDIRAGRPIVNPFGDGKQGVIDPADIAAVAAEVLTGDGHHELIYTLTGPELISVPEQLAVLAEILGRPLEVVDREPAPELFPSEIAEAATAGARLVRAGGNAVVTPDVEKLTSRRPAMFRAWAERAWPAVIDGA
ncbi:NAD(P)H-binding protein [Actinoplanes sp. TRM 88003]|uniref:NAD(P)H-binding protein n=1 Tax=Paractinoplanes aksuensis TaxID=2939490 RepID=A0ABT1E2H1_9ACTN|nr:NAD(P)H-binding protein [Actinoplanes aksuensis]MCO8277237.1 NAD(P)H-binding protein [Actinoplanes aksuensis]